ncbi:hypothetical protein Cpir12675_003898 [Ceratocystis pirilliformis]|uniref:Uncharacterized protein n=1 Tax=Ceratocystis pirilliformis TaxID=259994 RepID=A0ABR3Z0Y6_9PEZI
MTASHQPEGPWALRYNRHTFGHNNKSFQPPYCRNQPFDAQELSRRLLAVQVQQQKQEQQELQKQQKQHHKLQKLQTASLRKRQSMPLPRRLFSTKDNTTPKPDASNPESHTSHHTTGPAPKSASSTSSSSSSSSSKVDDSRRSSTSGGASATSISTSISLSSESQQQSSKPERSGHHHTSDQQRQHSVSSACKSRIATEGDEFSPSPAYTYRRKTYSRGSHPERADWIEGDEAKTRKKIWSRPSIMGLKHRLGGNGGNSSSHGGKQEVESLAGEAPHQQRAGLLRRFRKTPTA